MPGLGFGAATYRDRVEGYGVAMKRAIRERSSGATVSLAAGAR